MTELVKFNAAKRALAVAASVDEVKGIRDKAEALRAYHKQVGESLEMQNRCAEIKIRAERRGGELLSDGDRRKASDGRPGKASNDTTLSSIGISRDESSRWQRIASIPDDDFDRHMADEVADKRELTTASTLRLWRKLQRDDEKNQPDIDVPLPTGTYATIVIDPPWPMEKIDREVTPNQAAFGYQTMTLDEIRDLAIDDVAADDANLFLWTTQKFLPASLGILAAWDFRYIFTMVWHKSGGFQPFNLPQYNCEFVLFGRRGSGQDFLTTKAFPCCFDGKRREHSRKPDEFYDLVRRVSPGPSIDMFSREQRDGFAQWGNEVAHFAPVATCEIGGAA